MMVRFFCVTLVFLVMGGSIEAQETAAIPHQDGTVEVVSIAYPPSVESGDNSGPILWTENITRLDADFIQLEIFDRGSSSSSQAVVEFWDRSGEVHERISAADLVGLEGYWTNLIPSNSVDIVVRGKEAAGISFEITAVAYEKSGFRFESIVGADQRRHLREYEGAFLLNNPNAAPAVAKLSYIRRSTSGMRMRYNCTGFLVGEDLFVTNEHCVSDADTCQTAKALFGYERTGVGFARPTDQYGCSAVIAVDRLHDVALLRLETPTGEFPAGQLYGVLDFATSDVQRGDKLFIIQHPAGEAKQISDLDCAVKEVPVNGYAPKLDFSHTCDTLGGSSGSPVFNEAGEVVGLHHLAKAPTGSFVDVNRAVRGSLVNGIIGAHLQ